MSAQPSEALVTPFHCTYVGKEGEVRIQTANLRSNFLGSGHVDYAGRFAAEEGVGEFDDVRLGGGEDPLKRVEEIVVGRIVGPQGEDAAGLQVRGQSAQADE